MRTLPDCCCSRALSYLELREVSLVAQCSLLSLGRAYERELWLMLCEARWPAVASSEALRKAVLRRHPRDYFMHMYLDCYSPRPLLDLDDHLVQLEIRQKGRSLCSVAREARDVFRSGVTGYHEPDGILSRASRAVDCSDDDMFPPEAHDRGHVLRDARRRTAAILGTDSTFGTPGGARWVRFFKSFPQYPSLRGASYELRISRSLTPCGALAGHGWRDARGETHFEISTALWDRRRQPGNDRVPALRRGTENRPPWWYERQVEIRSIFM